MGVDQLGLLVDQHVAAVGDKCCLDIFHQLFSPFECLIGFIDNLLISDKEQSRSFELFKIRKEASPSTFCQAFLSTSLLA